MNTDFWLGFGAAFLVVFLLTVGFHIYSIEKYGTGTTLESHVLEDGTVKWTVWYPNDLMDLRDKIRQGDTVVVWNWTTVDPPIKKRCPICCPGEERRPWAQD